MSKLPFGGKTPPGGKFSPGGSPSGGGFDIGLQQALMRIQQLEAEVAKLSSAIKVAPDGSVEISAPAKITIKAASCTANLSQFTINCPMTTATGIIKCDVMQATTVIAATYAPGAGNVW
jgi:hypothetical protein